MTSQHLNAQVTNTFIDFVKWMATVGQPISAEFGLNGSDGMALHKIDQPVSMKELSQPLGCDASFVTAVADSLERHGLARREPSLRDRRSKNIVLTEQGRRSETRSSPKARRMPWGNALDTSERECFSAHAEDVRATQGGDPVTPAAVASS